MCLTLLIALTVPKLGLAQLKRESGWLRIISIAGRTKDGDFAVSYYFEIGGKLYSGDFLNNHNLSCRPPMSEKDLDTVYKIKVYQTVDSVQERIQKSTFKTFNISSPYIKANFYWKCYLIKANYIRLNCQVELPDLFEFYYGKKLNGVEITFFDAKSLKKSLLPDFMVSYLIAHEQCLKIWKQSYYGWRDCMAKNKSLAP